MGKTVSKRQPAIVMAVDRDARLLDLRVFAALNEQVEPEVVGNATLRLQDLLDVLALLSEGLRFQDQIDAGQAAARRARKTRKPIA